MKIQLRFVTDRKNKAASGTVGSGLAIRRCACPDRRCRYAAELRDLLVRQQKGLHRGPGAKGASDGTRTGIGFPI